MTTAIMTERDWLASTNPEAMLEYIRPQASPRQLRLFACACCREWNLSSETSQLSQCIATAEKDADGIPLSKGEIPLRMWSWSLAEPDAIDAARNCMFGIGDNSKAVHLLRLLFGNPFRPVWRKGRGIFAGNMPKGYGVGTHYRIAEASDWLTPQVLSLAQSCYDLRDPGYFPLIWDALEEAGCDNVEIEMALKWMGRCAGCLGSGKDWVQYGHGRSYTAKCFGCGEIGPSEFGTSWVRLPGEPMMVRGFWVVDLLLGKE